MCWMTWRAMLSEPCPALLVQQRLVARVLAAVAVQPPPLRLGPGLHRTHKSFSWVTVSPTVLIGMCPRGGGGGKSRSGGGYQRRRGDYRGRKGRKGGERK